MRTTMDLDETLVDEVVELTGEKKRGKAVNVALLEFIRTKRLEQLRALAGHIDLDYDWEEEERKELEDQERLYKDKH